MKFNQAGIEEPSPAPGTQDLVKFSKPDLVQSQIEKNDVTMWRNCHICTSSKKMRPFSGIVETNVFETWQSPVHENGVVILRSYSGADLSIYRGVAKPYRGPLFQVGRWLDHFGLFFNLQLRVVNPGVGLTTEKRGRSRLKKRPK